MNIMKHNVCGGVDISLGSFYISHKELDYSSNW